MNYLSHIKYSPYLLYHKRGTNIPLGWYGGRVSFAVILQQIKSNNFLKT